MKTVNLVKLGIFVIAGMAFLILLLYVIGKNQNLFGSNFILKARFENVNGLMKGNNIRYAGINAGTVRDVAVLNDTTVEVTLLVKRKMKAYIRQNAQLTITTDGLMGNKLINIEPSKNVSPPVSEGYVFYGARGPDTDEMLRVLSSTNNDIAVITKELKQTVQRINSSRAVWTILDDESLPKDISLSLLRVKSATLKMNQTMDDLHAIVRDVQKGKGSVGMLLKDSLLATALTNAADKIGRGGARADSLFIHITGLVDSLNEQVHNGKGMVNALLKDTLMKHNLDHTLVQLEKDAKAVNEILDAVKQSFLFRGYFNRQERKKKAVAGTGFQANRESRKGEW